MLVFFLSTFNLYYIKPISSTNDTDITKKTDSNKLDPTSIINALIGAGAGLGGFIWGLQTYKKDQHLRRKDIIFPLIKEFDESEQMKYAKDLLDDKTICPQCNWKYKQRFYHKQNFDIILRDHGPKPISDPGEFAIRKSFDALLDFFYKLQYLFEINLIKSNEIRYFKYYVDKIAKEENVINYINIYSFPVNMQGI